MKEPQKSADEDIIDIIESKKKDEAGMSLEGFFKLLLFILSDQEILELYGMVSQYMTMTPREAGMKQEGEDINPELNAEFTKLMEKTYEKGVEN